ncbi:MAG: molybdopterin-dependent oxidoreductase [Candidatus Limnocylindrales bacterium]
MQPIRVLAAPTITPRGSARLGAVAGVLAAGVALGVGHLVAAVVGPATSPLFAVGGVLIDAAPQAAKAFAIETFGNDDKSALLAGILLALIVVSAIVGVIAVRRPAAGAIAILAFGVVGTAAALSRPGAAPIDALPALAGAAVALAALIGLVRLARATAGADRARAELDARGVGSPPAVAHGRTLERRWFLAGALGVAGVAAASGGLGALLQSRRATSDASQADVPVPLDPAPTVDPATSLGVDGISAFTTPNASFYRVDTALVPPVIRLADWRLRVHGMVDRELTLTYDQLVALPTVERDITLTCVSNPVGGPYAGHARWIGVPLRAVLDEAGVQAGADQIVSRSIDGMTIGTPTAVALDGRDAILAVAMNGEPLPVEHGYPVRMVVPGLYGYVSATKWLTELELTTFDAYDAYWVQRGWAAQGPIRTMSRIDTPRPLATVPVGRVRVGGVAWAQHLGITRVEVRVDDGPWSEARLGAVDTVDTWRQWVFDWSATAGRHSISVRATDRSGMLQAEERAEPFPSGATGWHTVVVTAA